MASSTVGGPAGRTGVRIDMTHTTFLDAQALATLVVARRRLAAAGVDLAIRGPNAFVRRVFAAAADT